MFPLALESQSADKPQLNDTALEAENSLYLATEQGRGAPTREFMRKMLIFLELGLIEGHGERV